MIDHDACWTAVRARDKSSDGAFFYSVRTTGVYCRPSCAARLARRENVAFHLSCDGAARAGFRPCKRCRPDEPSLADRQAALVEAACRSIGAAVADGGDLPDLGTLARAAKLSPFHFHRVFRQGTGITPRAYAAAVRSGIIRQELAGGGPVTGAIHAAGYGSSSRFYERSTAMLGMRPTEYRDGGRNARIRFAVGQCSLGAVLVAATEKGICTIQFGDAPEELVADLHARFPQAELLGADAAFEGMVARVVGAVENPTGLLDLPLDLQGTTFQQRVWQALRAIPLGSTASYAAVAASIGMNSASRAVAGACAANPVAVAIPCHRVVRTDGGLSGYRWGIARKQALLDREAAAQQQARQ